MENLDLLLEEEMLNNVMTKARQQLEQDREAWNRELNLLKTEVSRLTAQLNEIGPAYVALKQITDEFRNEVQNTLMGHIHSPHEIMESLNGQYPYFREMALMASDITEFIRSNSGYTNNSEQDKKIISELLHAMAKTQDPETNLTYNDFQPLKQALGSKGIFI